MLGLLFVTFFIGRVMPVDPVLSIVGERATKEIYEAAYLELGLDKPKAKTKKKKKPRRAAREPKAKTKKKPHHRRRAVA